MAMHPPDAADESLCQALFFGTPQSRRSSSCLCIAALLGAQVMPGFAALLGASWQQMAALPCTNLHA